MRMADDLLGPSRRFSDYIRGRAAGQRTAHVARTVRGLDVFALSWDSELFARILRVGEGVIHRGNRSYRSATAHPDVHDPSVLRDVAE